MDHSYFRDKISAYSDGALEAQERELIRRHLADCADCRKLLDKIGQLKSIIDKQSELTGEDYFEKLAQKIEKRIAAPADRVVDVRQFRWKTAVWKFSAAAASILLVGTIGYYQFVKDEGQPQRLLQELKPSEEAVVLNVDSLTVGDREKESGKEMADEIAGGVTGQSTATKDKAKNETLAKESFRSAAEPAKLDRDNIGRVDAPRPPAAAAIETKVAEGKVEAGQTAGDERAERQLNVVKSPAEADDSEVREFVQAEEQNLEQLRMRNLSLQSQVSQDSLGYWFADKQDAKKSVQQSLKSNLSANVKAPDSVYQQLAISWYQISQLSQNKEDKNQAIQYLNWYKQNFPADSALANQYLKEISK